MDKVGEIKKLKDLLDKGAVTQEEFDSLKKQVIEFRDELNERDVTSTQPPNRTPKKEEVGARSNIKVSHKPTQKEAFTMFDKMDEVKIEPDNKTTRRFFRTNMVLSIIFGLIIMGSFDSFIAFLLITGAGIGLTFLFLRILKRQTRNASLIALSALLIILIFVLPDYGSTSISGSSSASESTVNDGDAMVRSFLTGNIFVNYGNGGEAYLRFDDRRAGWYGLVTLTFGGCDFIYNYETKGSRVNLDYNYSTCSGFSGGRASVRVNQNNKSLTLVFQGQELVFRPLF